MVTGDPGLVWQLATFGGARMIITSSSDAKLERARALGAHDGIKYTKTPRGMSARW